VATSIVIGLGVMALVISIAIRIYEKYGTFDITKINKLRG
jgi:multicomponent Na+:H+ antiporter subunit C